MEQRAELLFDQSVLHGSLAILVLRVAGMMSRKRTVSSVSTRSASSPVMRSAFRARQCPLSNDCVNMLGSGGIDAVDQRCKGSSVNAYFEISMGFRLNFYKPLLLVVKRKRERFL